MSLILPHSVQFGTPGGGYVTVRAQVTPMTASAAFSVAGVEASNPFMVICRVSDAGHIGLGGRMIWRGITYAVMSDPMVYEGIGAADHASVIVTRSEDNNA